jgi:ADP-heptose:LPS heptosyltransferase
MKRGRKTNRLLDFWVGIPLLNILTFFRRRRKPPAKPMRIGLMCYVAQGDTLLFSGVLQDIRAAFPSANITHICSRLNTAAANIISGADEKLVIEPTKPWVTIPLLRTQHFDVLVDFTSWPRLTALYTLLAGAKYTVGFDSLNQQRASAFDCPVVHRYDRHELSNFRALLHESGLAPGIESFHDPSVQIESPENPPFASEPDVIVLHLWASGNLGLLRQWPEDRWLELSKRLAQPNTLFLISGASYDMEHINPFVERMRASGLRCEPFVSPDGFRTLTYIMRRARLVVSVNTGVMHLAAIAGAPLVGLSGPTSNVRWGPVGPNALGVDSPGNGCGYLHFGFEFKGNPNDCMERISVDMVYATAQTLLQQSCDGDNTAKDNQEHVDLPTRAAANMGQELRLEHKQ